MDRRLFISSSLAQTIAPNSLTTLAKPRNEKSKWQPDGVGSKARIGVLTPDFDPVPESEMCAMAPPGVSIHSSRVAWNKDAASFAKSPNVDIATELLTGLKPHVILYAFTSSSYVLGADEDSNLKARLELRANNTPVILTCRAATDAFRMLSVNKIALIHPPWFSEEINASANDYFRGLGFEIIFCARMRPDRAFTEVSPQEVYNWIKSNAPREAEAIFVGGNGLRAVGAIHSLEEDLGKPVLTANQVLLWSALRLVSANSTVVNYGEIFAR